MYIIILIIWQTLLHCSTTFTPELAQLQFWIAQLETINHQLSQMRYVTLVDTDDPKSKYLLNYDPSMLNFISQCTFKGDNISTFFIQTTNQVYLAVNIPNHNQVQIYSSKCLKISVLNHIQIKYVLSDRGNCQNGMQLTQISEVSKFQKINKLTDLGTNSKIVEGVVKHRGKENVEIFVGYRNGTIEVYDELGKNKVKLFIEGNKSEIRFITDHHPYPLIVTTSSWVSMLDTSKYVEIAQNCPYIPKIRHIMSQHHYSDTGTSSTHKRQMFWTSSYSNSIFMNNKVFNMTDRKLFKRANCSGQSSLQFVFKRGTQDKELSVNRCCVNQSCFIEFLEMEKAQKSKSVLIYLKVGFIIILLAFLSLTKKTRISNIDIEDIHQQSHADYTEQKIQ